MFKIPLFKELKTDQWVKPFFKQYKVSLVIALFLGFMTFFLPVLLCLIRAI
ncbi:Transport ATP-binding protein CydC [Streptococcus agalactiae]|nr:Transport ATP-binding protein CydC [Streptococcus agalactiae]